MRLLVRGGRRYTNLERVIAILDKVHGERWIDVVVHGAAGKRDDGEELPDVLAKHSVPGLNAAKEGEWTCHQSVQGHLKVSSGAHCL
jgi:hypothetical protein